MYLQTKRITAQNILLTAVIATLLLTLPTITQAATGTTYHVRTAATGDGSGSDWANATTLQGALGTATSGDEIWVAAGIYKPTTSTDRTISFNLVPGVAIYGGFDPDNGADAFNERDWVNNLTVLSGDIDNNDTHTDGVVATANDISGSNSYHVINANDSSGTPLTNSAILDGFTITAGSANGSFPHDRGGGLLCESTSSSCSPTLSNLIFSGNLGSFGGGMFNYAINGGTSSPTLLNATLSGNRGALGGGGIFNYGVSNGVSSPALTNVLLLNNAGSNGGGMYNHGVAGISSPALTNVTFYGNSATGRGGGMLNESQHGGTSSPTLTNVIMFGDTASSGDDEIHNVGATTTINYSLIAGQNPSGTSNLLGMTDPLFIDAANGNLQLPANSPVVEVGDNTAAALVGVTTDLLGNARFVDSDDDGTATVDLGAYENQTVCPSGTTFFVDQNASGNGSGSDWTNATTDLADALERTAVCDIDEIWVAEGIYKPTATTDRSLSFNLVPGVAVYGGFDPAAGDDQFNERDWHNNLTILSGDIDNNDTHTDGIVSSGWDINGGNSYHVVVANGTSGTPVTATTILDGFIITAGQADSFDSHYANGGGFLCLGNGSGNACSPTVSNVTFSGNSAYFGGGMFNEGDSSGTSNPLLTHVSFSGNVAFNGGGGLFNDGYSGTSSPLLTNVTFFGNHSSEEGGAIYNNGADSGNSSPELTNVTIASNTSSDDGAGMFNMGVAGGTVNPTVTNVIMWGNTKFGVTDEIVNIDASPSFNYSLVQGLNLGGSNLDGANPANDPLFVDVANGNLRLQFGSPAIEAGDSTASGLTGITTDLAGNPRFVDTDHDGVSQVDLGAYENQMLCVNGTTLFVDQAAGGDASGSDWANGMTDLVEALGITAVCNINEIWVAEGIYKPTSINDRSASFNLMPGVAVYGGFDPAGGDDQFNERDWRNNVTILSGDIDNNDTHTNGVVTSGWDINGGNSYHVVVANGASGTPVTATTILDGFIITAGQADSFDSHYANGGGFLCLGNGSGNACSPTLTNITFSGNRAYFGGGMFNEGDSGGTSNPTLTHVIFSGNVAFNGGGGMFNDGASSGDSSPALTNVTFFDNSTSEEGAGMYNTAFDNGTSSPTLINVTFYGNAASDGAGGMHNFGVAGGTSNPTLTNVIMWGDTNQGTTHEITNIDASPTFNYSLIEGLNPGGTNLNGTNPANNPLFVDAANGGLQLQASSPAIEVGNNAATGLVGISTDLDGNPRFVDGDGDGTATVDLGAYEAPIICPGGSPLYVDYAATGDNSGGSWANAMPNLRGGLLRAATCSVSEIWVAQGVYKPTSSSDRNISFGLVPEVAVYGGFDPANGDDTFNERNWIDNPTILSGDIDNNDTHTNGVVTEASGINGNNSYHVVVADGMTGTPITNSTILDGFIITAGQARGSGLIPNRGGGFLCLGYGGSGNNCSPTLANVTFSGNEAYYGGGMFNMGMGGDSSPMLTNVTFTGNEAIYGAGLFNDGSNGGTSSPTLNKVRFSDNVATDSGGGMINLGVSSGISSPTLTDIIFTNNSAVRDGGAIVNNVARGVGNMALTNVSFFNNEASHGGAIFSTNQDGTGTQMFTNVTFSGNEAIYGGTMFMFGNHDQTSSLVLANVIMWGNTSISGGNKIQNDGVTLDISYSLVEDLNPAGVGNLDGTNSANDPLFVDAANGDLRLSAGSPAVDAGNNAATGLSGITTDLDGNARISDGDGNGSETVDMGVYEKAAAWRLEITAVNTTDAQLMWEPVGTFGGNCIYNIYESTTPYFDPMNPPTYTTSSVSQMLDDKLTVAETSYFYINEVTCDLGTTQSNEVGIFNFEIVPGTP